MEELKPCPFCGGEANFIKVKHHVGVWYAVCCDDEECFGHEQSRLYTLRRLAAEAWNRRAVDREELLKVSDDLWKYASEGFNDTYGMIEVNMQELEWCSIRIRKALGILNSLEAER